MQQDVHRQVSSSIVVNAHNPLPAPTAGTVTQPTCSTATGGFQITGYTASNTYTFTSVVSISGTGLVTANAELQRDVHRQYHQILLLMHNPLHQHQQQEQLHNQHVPQQQVVQITGYSASIPIHFTPSVVSTSGTGLVTPGTYTFTNNAGCTSPASSSIVVNAQPATPAAPTAEQLRSQHVQQQQAVSNHRYTVNNYTFTCGKYFGYRFSNG
jgi:hypothetical protein